MLGRAVMFLVEGWSCLLVLRSLSIFVRPSRRFFNISFFQSFDKKNLNSFVNFKMGYVSTGTVPTTCFFT
jgi:hypothetical protein